MSRRSKGRKWIKPFKSSKPVPITFIAFDCETRPQRKGELTHHLLRYGYAQHVKDGVLKAEYEFTTKRDFTKWLLNRFSSGHESIFVWGHNTSFDVRVGVDFNYLSQLNWSYLPVSVKPFIFKVSRNGQRIAFLDTFAFFQTSLKDLGEKFSLLKLQINDFTVADDETLSLRCKRDVEITRKVVEYLFNQMRHRVACSLPQLGFKLMRQTLEYPVACLKGISEESYYGGRSELYQRGSFAETVLLDVNSMHPFCMLNPLPSTFLYAEKNPSLKKVWTLMDSGYGVTAKVEVDVPPVFVPPFPYRRKDGRLLFPAGKFTTYLNSPELALAPEYVVRIHEMEVYRMNPFLQPFVNQYYEKRLRSKTPIDKEFYKLLLNSVYGKFAQKIKVTREVEAFPTLFPAPDYCGVIDSIDDRGHKTEMKVFAGKCYTQKSVGRAYSPAVSSYICSYARAYLHHFLKQAGNALIYADTDGFVIEKKCFPVFEKYLGDQIGRLKIDKEGEFEGFRVKMYRINGILKCKGVPRTTPITFSNGGADASYQHFLGMGEGIRRYGLSGVAQVTVKKHLHLEDDKRKWVADSNRSHPITL